MYFKINVYVTSYSSNSNMYHYSYSLIVENTLTKLHLKFCNIKYYIIKEKDYTFDIQSEFRSEIKISKRGMNFGCILNEIVRQALFTDHNTNFPFSKSHYVIKAYVYLTNMNV